MQLKVKKILMVLVSVSLIAVGWSKMNRKNTVNFLRVGMATGYAPFISTNASGNYEGFDIDVATALGIGLGKEVVFKDLGSMSSLLIALERGSIDVVMWGMSITQERLAKFAMVHYQGEKQQSNPLVFWKEIPQNIKTLAEMKQMRVCVEPASCQSALLAQYPDIIIVPTEKVDDALLNLQYGKADAAFLDPAIAKKFKAKWPDLKILSIPLDPKDYVEGMGIMLKKNNGRLIKQISDVIKELKEKGSIKSYEKKWGID